MGDRFLNFHVKDSRYNDNFDVTIFLRDRDIEILLYYIWQKTTAHVNSNSVDKLTRMVFPLRNSNYTAKKLVLIKSLIFF